MAKPGRAIPLVTMETQRKVQEGTQQGLEPLQLTEATDLGCMRAS
jgi:hypothetical protein